MKKKKKLLEIMFVFKERLRAKEFADDTKCSCSYDYVTNVYYMGGILCLYFSGVSIYLFNCVFL